jgi:hypothetical protein
VMLRRASREDPFRLGKYGLLVSPGVLPEERPHIDDGNLHREQHRHHAMRHLPDIG